MSETFEKLNNTVDTRFKNKKRDYTVQDVKKLSGSVKIDHTLAHRGSEKLWSLFLFLNLVSTVLFNFSNVTDILSSVNYLV